MWFSRFLAELLEAINPGLAAVIVVAGGYLGFRWADGIGENLTFGAGLGVVAGLIVAALVCGLIAIDDRTMAAAERMRPLTLGRPPSGRGATSRGPARATPRSDRGTSEPTIRSPQE